MNKNIGLFLPYFGSFPNYFELWIRSVAINPEIQFILITDQDVKTKLPSNLHLVKREFKDIQSLIREKFNDLNISIDNPYKLCDFRPAYGYVFEDLIDKYNLDYWGFCDPDVIWGKISTFLKERGFDKNNYDKVGYLGHFQLFSANQKFLFKNIVDDEKFRNYKYVFTHKYAYHFDEEIGIGVIAKKRGLNILDFEDNPPYADILINSYQFFTYKNALEYSLPRYFVWNKKDGLIQVTYKNGIYRMTPKMYVHLQKRNMKISLGKTSNNFYIIPNKIISKQQFDELNLEDALKYKFYFAYYKGKLKKLINKFSLGQIKHTYYFKQLLNNYYNER